jgi:hypothetical protein
MKHVLRRCLFALGGRRRSPCECPRWRASRWGEPPCCSAQTLIAAGVREDDIHAATVTIAGAVKPIWGPISRRPRWKMLAEALGGAVVTLDGWTFRTPGSTTTLPTQGCRRDQSCRAVAVFVQNWQLECCGDLFAVGDRVEWTLQFLTHEATPTPHEFFIMAKPEWAAAAEADNGTQGYVATLGHALSVWVPDETPSGAAARGFLIEEHHGGVPTSPAPVSRHGVSSPGVRQHPSGASRSDGATGSSSLLCQASRDRPATFPVPTRTPSSVSDEQSELNGRAAGPGPRGPIRGPI